MSVLRLKLRWIKPNNWVRSASKHRYFFVARFAKVFGHSEMILRKKAEFCIPMAEEMFSKCENTSTTGFLASDEGLVADGLDKLSEISGTWPMQFDAVWLRKLKIFYAEVCFMWPGCNQVVQLVIAKVPSQWGLQEQILDQSAACHEHHRPLGRVWWLNKWGIQMGYLKKRRGFSFICWDYDLQQEKAQREKDVRRGKGSGGAQLYVLDGCYPVWRHDDTDIHKFYTFNTDIQTYKILIYTSSPGFGSFLVFFGFLFLDKKRRSTTTRSWKSWWTIPSRSLQRRRRTKERLRLRQPPLRQLHPRQLRNPRPEKTRKASSWLNSEWHFHISFLQRAYIYCTSIYHVHIADIVCYIFFEIPSRTRYTKLSAENSGLGRGSLHCKGWQPGLQRLGQKRQQRLHRGTATTYFGREKPAYHIYIYIYIYSFLKSYVNSGCDSVNEKMLFFVKIRIWSSFFVDLEQTVQIKNSSRTCRATWTRPNFPTLRR